MRQTGNAPIYCGITNATLEISKNGISWPLRPFYAVCHREQKKEAERGVKGMDSSKRQFCRGEHYKEMLLVLRSLLEAINKAA